MIGSTQNTSTSDATPDDERIEQMVYDVVGPEFMDTDRDVDEPVNPGDQVFFDLLESSKKPIW